MYPRNLTIILLVWTFTSYQLTDADFSGAMNAKSVILTRTQTPDGESAANGYKVQATSETCEAAVDKYTFLCYDSAYAVGTCQVYLVETYRSRGESTARYLTKCPGNPAFYLKNNGPDDWVVIHTD